MIAALLVLLAVPLQAQNPQALVLSVMARAEKLVAAQHGKDARDIAALDRRAEDLYKELKPLGWTTARALGDAAKDLKRPAKVRLLATSFLALTADPAALAPLEEILLDSDQDPIVRSLAAQSLPGLGASGASIAEPLCSALAQEGLPLEVVRAAVLSVSRLGCIDPAALARLARFAGPRPDEKSLTIVLPVIQALGHSRGLESGKALLGLITYFPARGAARGASIAALDARRVEIATWLAPEALPVITEALRSESERWDTMLPLIRAARAFGPDAVPALSRLASHPDAEVLAEAVEALVAYKHVEALPALESIVAGAMNDPRFSPKEGRPDPAALLARLEKSVDALRRAR